jgi:hypothetical protein
VLQASDSKQKLWYVFDNALVLPEYLVEFQYDIRHSSPLSARSEGGLQLDITSQQHLLEQLDFDVRCGAWRSARDTLLCLLPDP